MHGYILCSVVDCRRVYAIQRDEETKCAVGVGSMITEVEDKGGVFTEHDLLATILIQLRQIRCDRTASGHDSVVFRS